MKLQICININRKQHTWFHMFGQRKHLTCYLCSLTRKCDRHCWKLCHVVFFWCQRIWVVLPSCVIRRVPWCSRRCLYTVIWCLGLRLAREWNRSLPASDPQRCGSSSRQTSVMRSSSWALLVLINLFVCLHIIFIFNRSLLNEQNIGSAFTGSEGLPGYTLVQTRTCWEHI